MGAHYLPSRPLAGRGREARNFCKGTISLAHLHAPLTPAPALPHSFLCLSFFSRTLRLPLAHKAFQNCPLLYPDSKAKLNAAVPGRGGCETPATSFWDCPGPSMMGPSLRPHLLPSYPARKASLHGLRFEVFLDCPPRCALPTSK